MKKTVFTLLFTATMGWAAEAPSPIVVPDSLTKDWTIADQAMQLDTLKFNEIQQQMMQLQASFNKELDARKVAEKVIFDALKVSPDQYKYNSGSKTLVPIPQSTPAATAPAVKK